VKQHIIARIRKRFEDTESGVTMILMALLMVVMMGAAAMAVDLGWLYLNSIRTQQAADAAALAGVVYMPDEFPTASTVAISTATANEYINGVNAVVTPAKVPGSDHQLRVTVDNNVPTFFMRVFGIDNVDISREAVAEYVLPLPLGSPESRFGNDPQAGYMPNFWANIHGYYTGKGMGDLYSSHCLAWESGSGCNANPDARETGYIYGVEVPAGATSGPTIELYDPAFVRGGGDNVLNGDNEQGWDSLPGATTQFTLYAPDPTPLDLSDNAVICQTNYAPRDPYPWYYTIQNIPWETFCSSPDYGPGIYPLQVRILHPSANERGLNRFSMRASTSGDQPRLYGLGDMSIYANVNAGITEFYLADVEEIHAGKTLIISLFDPGDASGNHNISIVDPHGNVPACDMVADGSASGYSGHYSPCRIYTSDGRYNDHKLTISIDLTGYTCSSDCWWKVRYSYPSTTQDTTTWAVHIDGNPVRLVS